MVSFVQFLAGIPVIKLGILASLVASVGTVVGALPVLASPQLSRRAQSLMVSAAAGVMLAATFFSLLAPALQTAETRVATRLLATLFVGLSMFAGALVVLAVHRWAPHEHYVEAPELPRVRSAWLFVVAITLHHFPEGIAVGVGFGGDNVANGVALTTAILFQNLPEGFIVGMALLGQGFGRVRSFVVASATGIAQLLGGVVGAIAISLASAALPWAMGFAAGAMLFVITHEMLAQAYREERGVEATLAILGGFVGMMVLEASLH